MSPEVFVVPGTKVDAVLHTWPPRIYITAAAHDLLPDDQYRALLQHEMGHWHSAHGWMKMGWSVAAICVTLADSFQGHWMLPLALLPLHYIVMLCIELEADTYAAEHTSIGAVRGLLDRVLEENARANWWDRSMLHIRRFMLT